MTIKKIIWGLVLAIGLAAIFGYIQLTAQKIAYVKTTELYDGFEMKKELEHAYIKVQTGRKQQLDSMELEINALAKSLELAVTTKAMIELFEAKRESYLQKKQQFDEDNAQMQNQYTSNIKKQLSQYVIDFGKENNYDYILGAEGSGSLMYAKEKDDITKQVLVYINNRYKGIR